MKNKNVLLFALLIVLLGGCIKVTKRSVTKTEDPADQKQATNIAELLGFLNIYSDNEN